ncbi:MAG: hypothetical protein AAFU41_14295 [Pseudomonadota bacterium]
MIETVFAFGIPLAIFAVACAIAFYLGKNRSTIGLSLFGGGWGVVSAILFLQAQTLPGWDGLGYAIALIFLSAPAGLGALLGGITGWMKSNIANPA